jgi:hypothetical protein
MELGRNRDESVILGDAAGARAFGRFAQRSHADSLPWIVRADAFVVDDRLGPLDWLERVFDLVVRDAAIIVDHHRLHS